MTDPTGTPDRNLARAAELASNARWIRSLARSLVADADLADDLVQDTLVTAIRHGGRSPSWLATVLRRRFFERRREAASRSARERDAARGEALPSTLEMVERAAVQRDLVQAVLELDEPFRTTILWRFFEDLPPRKIAKRAGVPVATVQSRITRGLSKLRTRLDGRSGGQGGSMSWLLALVPLLQRPEPSSGILGALLVKSSTHVALAAAGTAAIVAAVVLWPKHPSAPAEDARATAPALAQPVEVSSKDATASKPEIDRSSSDATRSRVETSTPKETALAAANPPPARTLRGEVLDPAGGRVAGIELRFSGASDPAATRGGKPAIRSGTDGRFEIPAIPSTVESILSADPRWSTVLAGSARVAPETSAIVVVAPRIDLAGTVVDEDGLPLRGAELAVHVPRAFGAELGRPLDASVERRWTAVTDDAGAFRLDDVPAIRDASLQVVLGGFTDAWQALPPASDAGLRIVLVHPKASTGWLAGIVVDPAGGLVPGARVSVGWESTFTDARGRFELSVEKTPAPARAIAAKEGFLPAVQDAPKNADGSVAWPSEVLLRLGGPPLAIAGRVVDGEGRGAGGVRVWLEDPTYFGLVEREPVQVETLLGRRDAPFWGYVATKDDGSFEIRGLLARTYGVRAMDPRTLLATSVTGVESGARDVEIRLPKDALHEKIAGHVVTRDGTPIAGALVVVQRFGFSVEFPGGGTRDDWLPRPEVTTDADGKFEIRDVPREGVELFVHGEEILFWSMELKADTPVDDLRCVVNRRMHLQVELDPPEDRADELKVLDGDGQPMILRIMRGETSFTDRKAAIVEGRSQVLSTSEDARTVVLFKGGQEVDRIPVTLHAGSVTAVRY
jgi:RNA polymerase sigma-70 factor (ECF subfamily)